MMRHYAHFTDEDAEAQRHSVARARSQIREVVSLGLHPRSFDSINTIVMDHLNATDN